MHPYAFPFCTSLAFFFCFKCQSFNFCCQSVNRPRNVSGPIHGIDAPLFLINSLLNWQRNECSFKSSFADEPTFLRRGSGVRGFGHLSPCRQRRSDFGQRSSGESYVPIESDIKPFFVDVHCAIVQQVSEKKVSSLSKLPQMKVDRR